MDLCSDSCEFLEGLAHKAMLQGARNIITMILDIVLKGSLKYNRLCCIAIFTLQENLDSHSGDF